MARERGPSVLVVSGDSAVRGATHAILPLAGWRVLDVPSYTLAMHNLKVALPQVLLMDQKFQEGDALALIKAMRYVPGNEQVVLGLMVDTLDRAMAVTYMRAGVQVFLAKPLSMVEVSEKLAEKVDSAGHLQPPPPERDPLVRPLVVLATPNLNFRAMAEKALNDEYDLLFFDGIQGLEADRRTAALLLVDEGLAGGLEALRNWQVLFGLSAPAVAMTLRGGELPEGYTTSLVKPVRATALKRVVRRLTGREHCAVFSLVAGVVIHVREGWQTADDTVFQGYVARIAELAALTRETGRRWVCLEGAALGAPGLTLRTRALHAAATGSGLPVGLVTLQSDLGRVAHDCHIQPGWVRGRTTDFIKWVQALA